jgi:hypothetical protein
MRKIAINLETQKRNASRSLPVTIKHQIDLQIKVLSLHPQVQLKLYLSKDITRQNASIFHVRPSMCRNILYTVV